jgi:hypothetical protein
MPYSFAQLWNGRKSFNKEMHCGYSTQLGAEQSRPSYHFSRDYYLGEHFSPGFHPIQRPQTVLKQLPVLGYKKRPGEAPIMLSYEQVDAFLLSLARIARLTRLIKLHVSLSLSLLIEWLFWVSASQ